MARTRAGGGGGHDADPDLGLLLARDRDAEDAEAGLLVLEGDAHDLALDVEERACGGRARAKGQAALDHRGGVGRLRRRRRGQLAAGKLLLWASPQGGRARTRRGQQWFGWGISASGEHDCVVASAAAGHLDDPGLLVARGGPGRAVTAHVEEAPMSTVAGTKIARAR